MDIVGADGSDARATGTWTAGAVARHLQIAQSTLRSWHQRYGLDPGGSLPGRYRRYTATDIARLRRMRDLIASGLLPSEAARAVMAQDAGDGERDLSTLIDAALALDTARCVRILISILAARGVVAAWDELCRPALHALEATQATEPECVQSEHILSWCILTALHQVTGPPAPADAERVLLACVPDEQHTLALEALAAALTERAVPVQMLGAATPVPSLTGSVAVSRPAAVVLWSQRPQTSCMDAVRALDTRGVRTLLAGPGWPPPHTARRNARVDGADVVRVTSLTEALGVLTSSTERLPLNVANG